MAEALNPEMAEEGGCGVHGLSSTSLWVPGEWEVTVLVSNIRHKGKGSFRQQSPHQGLHCQAPKCNSVQLNSHSLCVPGPLLHAAGVTYSRRIQKKLGEAPATMLRGAGCVGQVPREGSAPASPSPEWLQLTAPLPIKLSHA